MPSSPIRFRAVRKAGARIALLTALLAALAAQAARGAAPASFEEYEVKAAFLYNFAKFVEWPDEAFSDPRSPIVLLVVGSDPFGDALASLKGKTASGRPLAVLRAATVDDLVRCHILFVAASETPRLSRILQATKSWSTLVVGDVDGFARKGGAINLVRKEDRIAIEVNPEAAQRARLRISSKLLGLAKIVRSGPRGGRKR